MSNCFQVSLNGRVLGLFPNNESAHGFAQAYGDFACIDYEEFQIEGRFIPGLPF